MNPLLIFGTGELADLAWFYFSRMAGRQVVGFALDRDQIREESWKGIPIAPFDNLEEHYNPIFHDLFVAIGSTNVNRLRQKKYQEARRKGYRLASFISPEATVRADRVGDNCLILDHNNIHPFVSVGNNCIFSNGNHIGHHSVIEDHCFLTSNVVVGGGTRLGEGSFFGMNSVVRDHIQVGRYNLIGAGALILKNTQDYQVFGVRGTLPRRLSSDRIKRF